MSCSRPHARREILKVLADEHQIDQVSLKNAARQKRYRERLKARQPRVRYVHPRDRRSRPQRWAEAVETLRELQEEYQDWLFNLPDSLQSSTLAEKLEEVCALDIDQLDVELPLGFGRD